MSLVTLNLKPSDKQLRTFGLIGLLMYCVIGGLFFVLGKIQSLGLFIFFIAGIVLFMLCRISPKLIKPVYLVLILATFPIGWMFGHIVMAIFYYGVITVIALFFRLLKRDLLHRKLDPDVNTYWIPYSHERTAKDYFRQF